MTVILPSVVFPQEGAVLVWDRSSGVAAALLGGGCMVPLPEHPCVSHTSTRRSVIHRPVVLSEFTAQLLLQPLELPSDADPTVVYRGSAHNVDDPAFVHTVWFTPASAVATPLYPTEDAFLADVAVLDDFMTQTPVPSGRQR